LFSVLIIYSSTIDSKTLKNNLYSALVYSAKMVFKPNKTVHLVNKINFISRMCWSFVQLQRRV